MKAFLPGTSRELAKFFWDISKLTGTAAFITPIFTTVYVEPVVTFGMISVAMIAFVSGLILHHETDKLERERHNEIEVKQRALKANEQKPKKEENKEGKRKGRK